MSWTEQAEEFVGKYGFGSRGKHISISRMINPSDLTQLQTSQYVCAFRPRGIFSGFLVIHPQLQYAIYLPPATSKLQPQRFRVRIDQRHMEHGVIMSAYLYNKQLVIEDLIAIDGETVWMYREFNERWRRLKEFLEHEMCYDPFLGGGGGGITITTTSYMSLQSLMEPADDKIIEFVPCGGGGGQKRLIWIPVRGAGAGAGAGAAAGAVIQTRDCGAVRHVAKREAGMGPDVYSLYEESDTGASTKLGIALIRTLTASRALRLAFGSGSGTESVHVSTKFNKQFDKWEILDVASA